ncbi:DUF1127 domain-containing protein [Neorhizobium sp. NCHU2750]|uniref:DUF1127 domain-containing protein n=1 Tax=Neorhizobium sp. NCHU2750 TaxID=1825976 RepID=UPI000E7735C6|nr:hypothetical protein NCHU2750_18640 [Neorhizobium sp. NCHU2750]
MRKYEEYLSTIDTIYPDRYERESAFHVVGDMLPPAPMPVRTGFIAGLLDIVRNWQTRRAGRRVLRDMDHGQLQDIGVTRIAAEREVAKSRFLA